MYSCEVLTERGQTAVSGSDKQCRDCTECGTESAQSVQCELLTDSGQIVQCEVQIYSGQIVQCEVLTGSGEILKFEVLRVDRVYSVKY
jgi:hypothetical protein